MTKTIPAELKTLKQWVCWKYETRDGKKTKVPYTPGGAHAQSNNGKTWSAFADCVKAATRFDGIGVMFANELAGIDLDHCIDDAGQIADWAQCIVSTMDTYTEITPSGHGLHCLFWGKLPKGERRKGQVEMYDAGRFFTVTGNHLPNTPTTIERRDEQAARVHAEYIGARVDDAPKPAPTTVNLDDAAIIEKARAAKNGDAFAVLWRGDTTAHAGDASAADLALCSHLAFWCGGDMMRIDRLFRQSGLYRDKWDEPHSGDGRTYGQMTLTKALAGVREFYTPGNGNGHTPKNAIEIPVPTFPKDAPKSERFKIFSADDALDPQPPIEWIVEKLFSAGSVSVVYGLPGCKKTWTMLDCGITVNAGADWLGFKTARSVVLIVDEERGERRLKRRLGATLRGHSIGKGETKIFCTSLSGLELMKEAERAALERLVTDTGAKFVIIDSLIDVLIGGDENKSGDIQTVMRGLRHIAEKNQCAVVVIHHPNKQGGYRGSLALLGACDFMLIVESKGDSREVSFKTEKMRDGEHFSFTAIANFVGLGGDVDSFNLSPGTPPKAQERFSKSEKYVTDYLAKGDATTSDIEANADVCTGSAARKAVYALVARGKVERRNPGAKGTTAIYGLVKPKEGDGLAFLVELSKSG